jgi:hypothetical protein
MPLIIANPASFASQTVLRGDSWQLAAEIAAPAFCSAAERFCRKGGILGTSQLLAKCPIARRQIFHSERSLARQLDLRPHQFLIRPVMPHERFPLALVFLILSGSASGNSCPGSKKVAKCLPAFFPAAPFPLHRTNLSHGGVAGSKRFRLNLPRRG